MKNYMAEKLIHCNSAMKAPSYCNQREEQNLLDMYVSSFKNMID